MNATDAFQYTVNWTERLVSIGELYNAQNTPFSSAQVSTKFRPERNFSADENHLFAIGSSNIF
jgi:hypothetical protein